MLSKVLASAVMVSMASGHIVMTNPVPYGKASLNNSPLDASGSDFPCKHRDGVYDQDGPNNVYKQGSTQQLSFQGTAVHGGGSCQVSVTKDLKPTKDSVWKVIKSIEGGCPAKDQIGNLGDNAAAPVPYKYDFDIPKDLKEGNYTLAWTWFNKVGNREMYMNCAPMTVEGSGGSDGFMDSLPDMFVAQIGGSNCGIPEGNDVQFPNPGKDVDRFNGKTSDFHLPTGDCGGSVAGSAAAPTTTAAAGRSGGSEPTSAPGAIFVTKAPESPPASEAPIPVPTTAAGAPVSSNAPESGSGSGSGGTSGGSSGGSSGGAACSMEGGWNCIGGTSFQRCANGLWTAPQPMAAGVSCTPGQSAELKMAAAGAKRGLRHAARMVANLD